MIPWKMDTGDLKLGQSSQRTVILSVTMVGSLAAFASIYEYYHLSAMDRLNGYMQSVIPLISVFLATIVTVILMTKGRALRLAVWSVFALGSAHLLTMITLALLHSNDMVLAAEHALWIIAVQICLFATLERRMALGLSGALFALMGTVFLVFSYTENVSLIADIRGGFLVHLTVADGAILVLLGGLSTFREVALVAKTRAEASEDHATLLVASTEEANAERRRALRALKKAEEAAHAREAFLASMSHELRTPLNAIIGFAQILELEDLSVAAPADKRQEYAADIRNSGEHMLGLIGQILEYSRLESEGVEIHKSPQAVAKIAESSLRMISVLARAKQVNLEQAWDIEDDFLVETDEQALGQVLVNLLSNAVKFTPEGGTVSIRINREKNGTVCIAVMDTGIGIPADKVARVCDPFFQVGDQKTAGTDGTGLGLSIVTTLLNAMGAYMEIESVVGEGTCCRIKMPNGLSAEIDRPADDKIADAPRARAAS